MIVDAADDTAASDTSGDALIATFGGVLVRSAGQGDLCCRVGVEEFVVLTADADVEAALDLVGRVREAWAEIRHTPVALCVGAAPIEEDRGGPAALLTADRALGRARNLGPDHTEVVRGDF
jgi:diguanylate cyclase (GGDEF)-like protein